MKVQVNQVLSYQPDSHVSVVLYYYYYYWLLLLLYYYYYYYPALTSKQICIALHVYVHTCTKTVDTNADTNSDSPVQLVLSYRFYLMPGVCASVKSFPGQMSDRLALSKPMYS